MLFVALVAAIACGWFLFRTRRGFELRAAGLQPEAAEYGGVDVGGVWWRAMVLSGAIAGIGGLNFVLGYKHYYEEAFASGAGFLGIAVAIVGRNHPLGVVLAALRVRDDLAGRARRERASFPSRWSTCSRRS